MTSRDCLVATRITCGPELIWKSGLAFFEQLKMRQDHKTMVLTLNKTDLAFWTFFDEKVLKFEHFHYKRKTCIFKSHANGPHFYDELNYSEFFILKFMYLNRGRKDLFISMKAIWLDKSQSE